MEIFKLHESYFLGFMIHVSVKGNSPEFFFLFDLPLTFLRHRLTSPQKVLSEMVDRVLHRHVKN